MWVVDVAFHEECKRYPLGTRGTTGYLIIFKKQESVLFHHFYSQKRFLRLARDFCRNRTKIYWVCQKMKSAVNFLFWREKSTDLKSVDMSTNQQICSLSTDRRPGTIFFYVGSPLGDLNPLSYPRSKKNMISTFTPALCVRIIRNHAFPSCLPAAVGEYWQWLFTSTP